MRACRLLCLVGIGPPASWASGPRDRGNRARSRLAFLDRTQPVGDPLAPRPWIQARTTDPGMFQREKVVARGDAGTAVAHHVGATDASDRLFEPRTQIRRSEEATISQTPLEEVIDGSRNVSGDGVERLHVTAITFRCSRVYEVRA